MSNIQTALIEHKIIYTYECNTIIVLIRNDMVTNYDYFFETISNVFERMKLLDLLLRCIKV